MASSAASGKPAPLSGFEKLSPHSLLYRPGDASGPAAGDPKLIVLCSWMEARDPHIAKYTARLQALFPSSPILLIRSVKAHFSQRRVDAAVDEDTDPAAAALRSIVGAGPDGPPSARPELLILSFSNGGSTRLRRLCLDHAAQARPGEPTRLPAHAAVFDSSPGTRFHYRRGAAAMTAGLRGPQRWLALPLVHLVLLYWKLRVLLASFVAWLPPDQFADAARLHNRRAGPRAAEVRRAYVYSEEDELVDFREIEQHAREAEYEGFVVRREKFPGSPHVAHARTDEERYWRIVRETWEGR